MLALLSVKEFFATSFVFFTALTLHNILEVRFIFDVRKYVVFE